MDDRLRDYITARLKQGIPFSVVRAELISQGYTPDQIPVMQERSNSHKTIVIFLLILFILVLFSGITYYFFSSGPSFHLSVIVSNQSVSAGSSLEFVTSVFGSSTKSVVVFHELQDSQNTTVLSVSQKIIPGKSVRSSLSLPSQSGQYALVSATENVRVVQFLKISPVTKFPIFCSNGIQDQGETGIDCGGPCSDCIPLLDTCTDSCDDGDSCTQDFCMTGACMHNKIISCCGDFTCSYKETAISCPQDCALQTIQKPIQETTANAIQQASQDIRKSIQICSRLSIKNDKDQCLAEVGVKTNNSIACDEVADSSVRDVCYLEYAQKSADYSVCDKINNRLFKASCFSFRNSVIN